MAARKATVGWALLTAGYFVLVAIGLTYPLIFTLSDGVPGPSAGDNVSFVWAVWWVRFALARGMSLFECGYICVPVGADLTLHTHFLPGALAAAGPLAALGPIAALDVVVISNVALNGAAACLLARRMAGGRLPPVLAGTAFMSAPFFAAHLQGHFNLTAAWVLPLVAWATDLALATGRRSHAVLCGVLIALAAYLDYYFFVYAAALVVAGTLLRRTTIRRASRGAPPAAGIALASVASVALLIGLAVLATGGATFVAAGHRVSMTGVRNPLAVAFWAAVLWALTRSRWRPALVEGSAPGFGTIAWIGASAIVSLAPLLIGGVRLYIRGDYVSQPYLWRSAPSGVDLVSLAVGHPFQWALGSPVARWFESASIDLTEGTAYLGVCAGAVLWITRRAWLPDPLARRWAVFGGLALVWALGPFLHIAGIDTGVPLPAILGRYVPIVANARMPGRAMVLCYLALSVLMAIAVQRAGWSARAVAIVMVLVIADHAAVPLAITHLPATDVTGQLAGASGDGVLMEVPVGLRDGFGETGRLNPVAPYFQTLHQRRVTGGFVARMSPRVREVYRAEPVMRALLALSRGSPPGEQPLAACDGARFLERWNITHVVIDRGLATPAAADFATQMLPIHAVSEAGGRTLYSVRPGACPP